MNYELTIIVPVFNEEDNLERVYRELERFMETSNISTKVLFINDGSKDNSLERIRRYAVGPICLPTAHSIKTTDLVLP